MKRPIPVLIALTMTAIVAPHGASAESIAVFTKNTTNPFSKAIRLGADTAGKKLSVDISHYVPTTADNAATVPTTPSPNAMIAKRLWRSTM